jgi:D-arabinose 1-dehydrogenase-like Zn-dependent alcohol dehydrogenase
MGLVGKRVLPLRGQGTWQRYVDCPAEYAIPVPDNIDSRLAARAYINPLAAQMMLAHYPPQGKRVLLTAAGSDCAILLAQWARQEERKRYTVFTVRLYMLKGWMRWGSFPSRNRIRRESALSLRVPMLFTMQPEERLRKLFST